MPKFIAHMGVTLRSYGNVEVEADTPEEAVAMLTADFIGDNIEITETIPDSGQDLTIIDLSSSGGWEGLDEWGGHQLPNPFDPEPAPTPSPSAPFDAITQAAPALLAALKALSKVIADARADEGFDAASCDAGGIIFGDVASEAMEAATVAIAAAERVGVEGRTNV